MSRLSQITIIAAVATTAAAWAQNTAAKPADSTQMAADIQTNFKQWVQRLSDAKTKWEAAKIIADSLQGVPGVNRTKAEANFSNAEGEIARQLLNTDMLIAWLYPRLDIRKAGLLSEVEEKQLDKQTGASGGTPASTSLTSKGPTAQILALAVENGALQQTVTGTVITIRGNPAGILTAMAKKNLVQFADAYHDDANLRFLERLSLSATFDISKGTQPNTFTAANNQLTGYSAHFDLYNHRDPRHPTYDKAWRDLDALALQESEATNHFRSDVLDNPSPPVQAWIKTGVQAVEATPAAELEGVLRGMLDQAKTAFKAQLDAATAAGDALEKFANARKKLIDMAVHSAVTSFEYNNIRQFSQAGSAAPAPPDLSNLKFIYTRQFVSSSSFTFNAGATLFDSRPLLATGNRIKRIRDAQSSAEFDIPLPAIGNLGKGMLSFSGLWLRLFEEPLGQKVQVNGKDVTMKGTIGVAQVKVSFPLAAGVQVPLALTYATRTDLLPDKAEVRGNIGLNFDLDKLFAKSSQ